MWEDRDEDADGSAVGLHAVEGNGVLNGVLVGAGAVVSGAGRAGPGDHGGAGQLTRSPAG